MSDDVISKIEHETKDQWLSALWFSARRYSLTASIFGEVFCRRVDTPPDNLILRVIQPKQFWSVPTEWGIEHDRIAIPEYCDHQHIHGHRNLTVTSSGLVVSGTHPFLAASPDGAVYDLSDAQQPLGFLEVKCISHSAIVCLWMLVPHLGFVVPLMIVIS